MLHRFSLFAFLLAVLVATAGPAARAVDPADLKPGLIAVWTGPLPPEPKPGTITRLEPTVALSLGRDEAPHPRLAGLHTATWSGYVNLVRPGTYTFSANLAHGRLTVVVGGQTVLEAEAPGAATVPVTGPAVRLDAGVLPFQATFAATGMPCRVELFWQGPGFIAEPLNGRFLGHLASQRPPGLFADTRREHGRFLFEELACVRCHHPAGDDPLARTLADRPGPNLTEVGQRAYAGWIFAWLADPARHRPHTAMPRLFTADARGTAERYAVTRYLLAVSGNRLLAPYKPNFLPSGDVKQSFERGRVLYTVAGCAACHRQPQPPARDPEDEQEPPRPEDSLMGLGTSAGPAATYALGAVGSKTRPEALAAFLLDPLRTHPAGRMPDMRLTPQEAQDLARYLCRLTDETIDPALPAAPADDPAALRTEWFGRPDDAETRRFATLPPDRQWAELGRAVFHAKGCGNCHAVEDKTRPVVAVTSPTFPSLEQVKKAGGRGCLTETPNRAPIYKLAPDERAALIAFLADGLSGAGRPAPGYAARVALRRFNCLNCHVRDGEGGIPTELAEQMRLLERAENADDVRPPLLTGIGHKSRTTWLKAVLVGGSRARPWMQLRMPQYGPAQVGFLPEALAHAEGTLPDDTIHTVPLTAERVATGRLLVGKGGLGCISCHDIGGVANTGTRGPELSTINQRVRYDWYERWLHQPLRLAPGTRMPQAFVDGKSVLGTVLGGDPRAQAQAMWAYLSLGPGLPLPEGLEPPRGLVLVPRARPEILRTFLPGAGNRAVAVGYPEGIHVAFSADQCRLAYAWSGNFLDASPVWANRGGNPAQPLGPRFWTAPNGHPWGLTAHPDLPPDFAARERNPAFGTPLPLEPPRVATGLPAVTFEGYTLAADGRPSFRYRLQANPHDAVLKVAETVRPLRSALATGFARTFELSVPAGYTSWFLAGGTGRLPRVVGTGGAAEPDPDRPTEAQTVPATGFRVILPQDNDRVIVLEATAAPAGAQWRFPRRGDERLALLRLPAPKEQQTTRVELVLWALPKDDPALLRALDGK